eukprot:335540_1
MGSTLESCSGCNPHSDTDSDSESDSDSSSDSDSYIADADCVQSNHINTRILNASKREYSINANKHKFKNDFGNRGQHRSNSTKSKSIQSKNCRNRTNPIKRSTKQHSQKANQIFIAEYGSYFTASKLIDSQSLDSSAYGSEYSRYKTRTYHRSNNYAKHGVYSRPRTLRRRKSRSLTELPTMDDIDKPLVKSYSDGQHAHRKQLIHRTPVHIPAITNGKKYNMSRQLPIHHKSRSHSPGVITHPSMDSLSPMLISSMMFGTVWCCPLPQENELEFIFCVFC